MEITLLKLGGSYITDKSKLRTLNEDHINSVGVQIAHALKKKPDLHLICGNGAGSFAHRSAKKYNTSEGITDENSTYGACVVHHDALFLNAKIVEVLIQNTIPAYSLQPSAFIMNSDASHPLSTVIIEHMLSLSVVPVMYGDVVMDKDKGVTILSTDTLFRLLAEILSKRNHLLRIIHVGEYRGVLNDQGEVIKHITPSSYPSVLPYLHAASTVDITGGMKRKVDDMIRLAKRGIRSYILNGTEHDAIYDALLGDYSGTLISND